MAGESIPPLALSRRSPRRADHHPCGEPRLPKGASTQPDSQALLRFSASLQKLSNPQGFADHLQPARHTEWVVYAKPPFAGPQQVLDYVGRYTHRVAIANQRLLDMDDGHVRFRYTDYRAQASQTTMTLDATEFIRRVLLHVLPSGFHRRPVLRPPGPSSPA